jgi:hypothetical protein
MSKTRTPKTRGTTKSRTANDAQTAQAARERVTAQDELMATLRANPAARPPNWPRRLGSADPPRGSFLPAWLTKAA